MKHTFAAALCAALFVLTASAASASSIAFHVEVNTQSLAGNSSAPFALDFQLNGGTPLGNTATISNFTFGGGAAASIPSATYFGLAMGDLSSTVTLKDDSSNFFNEFYQGFTPGSAPGSAVGFDVFLTNNVNTPTPDAFSFTILDKMLANITTNDPGNSLLLVNLDSPNLGFGSVQQFAGTGAFASVTVTATPVPEPASLLLMGVGLLGLGAGCRRRPADRV